MIRTYHARANSTGVIDADHGRHPLSGLMLAQGSLSRGQDGGGVIAVPAMCPTPLHAFDRDQDRRKGMQSEYLSARLP
jgi:hypothetical protein